MGAATAAAVAAALGGAAVAEAVTGGTATAPGIDSVHCDSNCRHGKIRVGSTITVRGSDLSAVTKVVFLGARGGTDDVAVDVAPTSDSSLTLRVPFAAVSGPLRARVSRSVRSDPSASVDILPPPSPTSNGQLSQVHGPSQPGAPTFETATGARTVFFGADGATFSYRIDAAGPAAVSVSLVRLSDDAVVRSWTKDKVSAGVVKTVHWNATIDGKAAPDTRYVFRMTATSPTGAEARNASDGNLRRDAFDLHGYIFPVDGPHTYGSPFGAPRPGRTHQGQDVIASCGTPLRAARGGVVKENKYQSAAGNYIVIDGTHTGDDFMYAHLASPSPIHKHAKVLTGQRIGVTGATGDATGCHLHYEMWTPPGWYSGGHPFDPVSYLKAWDAYS